MDKVSVEVLLTEQDVINYQKAVIKRTPVFIVAAFGLFLFVIGVYRIITGEAYICIDQDQTLLLPTILQIVFGALFLFIPFGMRKAILKSYKTNKLLQKPQCYEINHDGIHITSEYTNSSIKWSDLYKAKDTKLNFLLYLSKQQAYVLPKRCFSSVEEVQFMQEVIKLAPVPRERGLRFMKIFRWSLLVYIALAVVVLLVLFLYQSQ